VVEAENSTGGGMSYDVKCYVLAQLFLDDCDTKNAHTGADHKKELAEELAQIIQTTIEDFIAEELTR